MKLINRREFTKGLFIVGVGVCCFSKFDKTAEPVKRKMIPTSDPRLHLVSGQPLTPEQKRWLSKNGWMFTEGGVA